MSRCFPFPPPGYMRNNGSRSEALIESIKLQRETEKAKKDRKKEKKEKKNEKKEKRKEKKERKHKESSHPIDAGKKFKLIDEIKETRPDGKLQKGEDYENEQLERSGITEELDQPVSSREPCCLSDSTQSSSKRKRGTSLSSHDHGPAIRIRLPLRKHREPEESKPGIVKISDSSTQVTGGSDCQLQSITNIETNQLFGNSDSKHCKALQNLVPADTPVTNEILDDESQRMVSLYNSLCQIPPLTYDGFNSEGEDWLFSSTEQKEVKPVSKKLKSDINAFRCSKSLWPRAQYLPEVEMYALPYAVPF